MYEIYEDEDGFYLYSPNDGGVQFYIDGPFETRIEAEEALMWAERNDELDDAIASDFFEEYL